MKIKIKPNDQSWVGKKLQPSDWSNKNHFIEIKFVGGETFLGRKNFQSKGFCEDAYALDISPGYWEFYEEPKEECSHTWKTNSTEGINIVKRFCTKCDEVDLGDIGNDITITLPLLASVPDGKTYKIADQLARPRRQRQAYSVFGGGGVIPANLIEFSNLDVLADHVDRANKSGGFHNMLMKLLNLFRRKQYYQEVECEVCRGMSYRGTGCLNCNGKGSQTVLERVE